MKKPLSQYHQRRLGLTKNPTGFGRVLRADDGRIKHGMCRRREYYVWIAMLARCNNKRNKSYHRYGGRGIKVCKRWSESFAAFFKDMGPANGLTIERMDNDGGYTPKNCCWIPLAEQCLNNSRTQIIKFNGLALSITQWGLKTGIKRRTISSRLAVLKWSVERALTTTVHHASHE